MGTRILEHSKVMAKRAQEIIPGGSHTYSKGDDQFPQNAPSFLVRGQGAHTWDVDGNEYIDWGMGLRSVVLGHAYEPVLEAVREHLALGSNFTRPAPIEVEVAEEMLRTVPGFDMVKFAKNGSDVTSAAIRLARAHTGRDLVAFCADHPFFSVQDWFIGTTPVNAGIPHATSAMSLGFRYNDIEGLRDLFDKHPGRIACVIMEPMTLVPPAPGYLQAVADLCHEQGALLILDEIITGFRWHLGGAQAYFRVKPDLCTFGKALGNGFSVAALLGRREIMDRGGIRTTEDRVFLLSATYGGETHSLAAAHRTIAEMRRLDTVARLWETGTAFMEGVRKAAERHGLTENVAVLGHACSPGIVFRENGTISMRLKTLVMQEVIDRGILFPGYVTISQAHSREDVARTVEAFDAAFAVASKALASGDLRSYLQGPETKPVFRRRA